MTVLLDFVDVHSGVNGEVGIADGRTGGSGKMMGGSGELTAGTIERIGVAVALGAGHGQAVRGDQFIKGSTMTVQSDVAALGLGDLQEVTAHTGEADVLRGSDAAIGGGHAHEMRAIDQEDQGSGDEKSDNGAHIEIVGRGNAEFKNSEKRVAEGNNALQT